MCERFCAPRDHGDIGHIERCREGGEKCRLLRRRFDQRQAQVGPDDLQDDAGEPGTRAEVEHVGRGTQDLALAQRGTESDRFQEVAALHDIRIDIADEIRAIRPLAKQVEVALELHHLIG